MISSAINDKTLSHKKLAKTVAEVKSQIEKFTWEEKQLKTITNKKTMLENTQ